MKNSGIPEPLDPELFPHKRREGKLPATIENMAHLLEGYGIEARYNVIGKKLEIRSDRWSAGSDNADNTNMARIVSLACLNGLPLGNVEAYVAAVGDLNPYNPVEEWITGTPWDGIDRLQEVYATLELREGYPTDLAELLLYKWLLSAVAAALLPRGFRCRGVLTFQGPQSIGKTQWVGALIPDPKLRAAVVKLDHNLDPHNKDSVLGAVSHWIVELGELDSAMRRDIARLKGVITRDSDKVRKPYARVESEMPRRTVFAATVNHPKFLMDDTGNSRFWTIAVTGLNYNHRVNMQQVFAQLAAHLKDGAEWWLTPEEERRLDEQNRAHRAISAVEDLVLDWLDLDRVGEDGLPARSPRDLLAELGIERPTNTQCKECAGVLRAYLGESKRIQGKDVWRVPLRKECRKVVVPGTRDEFD
jgi:predicted P-loop ATPase